MSALAIAALVLVCIWLGVLTLVVVLLVRQIGLLTVRLSVASQAFSLDDDGPEVGIDLPEEVTSVLPELKEGRAYLLLISAGCTPCRELVADLDGTVSSRESWPSCRAARNRRGRWRRSSHPACGPS